MNLPQAIALIAFVLVVLGQIFTIFGIMLCVRDGEVPQTRGFSRIDRLFGKIAVTIIACAIVLRVLA